MPIKGRDNLRRYLLEQTPKRLNALARGAAEAGGEVIRELAQEKCRSPVVRGAITVTIKSTDAGRAVAKVWVKGAWANSVATWLEYGTSAHFISVDPDIAGGRSVERVNRLTKGGDDDVKGTLVINGKPVGRTVHHPGGRPHPFMRPALDESLSEAVAAAQGYINGGGKP